MKTVKLANLLPRLLILLGLTLLWATPGIGLAQTFKVVQSKQQLYAGS